MKHISVIGEGIPTINTSIDYLSFYSNASLSDTDILIFYPNEYYADKEDEDEVLLSKEIVYGSTDFKNILQAVEHWEKEFVNFLECGGTLIISLSPKMDLKYKRPWNSNKKDILIDNYALINQLVRGVEVKNLEGTRMNASPIFNSLYQTLNELMNYKVYITSSNIITPTFMTPKQDRILGGYNNNENGVVVLLPYISFEKEEFVYNNGTNDYWTDEAKKLGQTFIDEIIKISKQLKSRSDKTPPPEWAQSSLFNLEAAEQTKTKIKNNLDKINKLGEENESLNEKLIEQEILKGLLYETGKPLEESVRKALKLLGYEAEGYDNGKLELDQVIVSPEGHRYIGECEGKDDKPIALKKFRQLLDSLKNYMYSEDKIKEVYGILIGNPCRLINPEDRGHEEFTPHCIDGAKREKIGLLTTESLFYVTKYIQKSSDIEFAKKCREAIYEQLGGVIIFPEIPLKED